MSESSTQTTEQRGGPRKSVVAWQPRWGVMFAFMFLFTTSLRAMLISVIPLQALDLLGSAQRVSAVYFFVGLFGIIATILVPRLITRLGPHKLFALGVVLSMLYPALLATHQLPVFVIGMVGQVVGIACIELVMNLYLMEKVPRNKLYTFEPIRVVFSGSAFIIGPWAGVYLENQVAHWAPFALTAACAAAAYGYSRLLNLHQRNHRGWPAQPANPIRNIRRFLIQPRLNLAWAIAFSRNGWWSIFFIYAPIYATTHGISETSAGAIVSVGSLAMYLVPFWGWVGRRYGLRPLLIWGFAAMGLTTPLVLLAGGSPTMAAVLLITGALVASTVDGAGHIAFYRAVKPLQRPAMTGLYLTYRDVSQLLPPAVFAVLLSVFPLSSIYVVGSVWMIVIARLCRYVPRRL